MRAVLLIVLVGCAGPERVEPGTAFGIPLPDRENQGRTILGDLDDLASGTDHYWVSGSARTATGDPVTVTVQGAALRVQQGALVYSGDDPRIIGIQFDGADGKQVTITNVTAATAEEPVRYYLSHDGTDPCAGEGAVALAGRVTIDARHDAHAGELTFACEKGVAYKCSKWGYIAGPSPAFPGWDLHQACMYMAGARYCADRRTFTREGTQVAMFDRPGVRVSYPPDWVPAETWAPWQLNTWPPPHDEFYVEAAWRANGTPRCLSKVRWASLPLAPCGAALPDPRTDPSGQYCEDLIDEGALTPNDTIIVNTSLFNDVEYTIWGDANGDLVGTVRGFLDNSLANPASIPPFEGMTFVAHSGVLLRALTSEMNPNDVRRLDMYCVPKTHRCVVTLPGTLPNGTTHIENLGPEGYAFVSSRPGTAELRLYYDAATDDYVSSTRRPGPSYAPVTSLGWILTRAPN